MWGTYIFNRLSGFGLTQAGVPHKRAPETAQSPGKPMRIVGQRWEQRDFSEFYASNTPNRSADHSVWGTDLHCADRLHGSRRAAS